ncbi:MAG TPA: nucleotidyltransferase family protein [Candidatus Koribacter sp.]|jgi:CTP:molybdopterin cytidylyltransferase MocA
MTRAPGFCGVILAAGASTRMGRDKALLPWPADLTTPTTWRQTFLGAAIEMLRPHTDLVMVVAGANENSVMPVVYSAGAFLITNPNPELGQFSSLQVGLQEVMNRGRDAAMVALVDRPPVLPKTVEALRAAFIAAPDPIWAVVPEFQGKHGHPYVMGREMIGAFLRAPVTATAQDVEHANQAHILYQPVNDPHVCSNIDTPEDFQNLSQSHTGPTH